MNFTTTFQRLKDAMDEKQESAIHLWKAEFNAICARKCIQTTWWPYFCSKTFIDVNLCKDPEIAFIEMNIKTIGNLALGFNGPLYFVFEEITDLREQHKRIMDRHYYFFSKLIELPPDYQKNIVDLFDKHYSIMVRCVKENADWCGIVSIREKNIHRKLLSPHALLRKMRKKNYDNSNDLLLMFNRRTFLTGFEDEQIYFRWI